MKLRCWTEGATLSGNSSSHDGDSFRPKPSPLSEKYCLDSVLPNDHDIWVESSYQSSTTGATIPYYRSIRTGQCRKMDPPTGARRCVRKNDNAGTKDWLHAVAQQQQQCLSKDQIRSIPTPRPNPKVVQSVMELRRPRRRARHRGLRR